MQVSSKIVLKHINSICANMFCRLSGAIYFMVLLHVQAQNLAEIDTPIPLCRRLKCPVSCLYGYVRDKYGCETCKCYDPCCNYPCSFGELCIVEQLFCIRPPCRYITRCVLCPQVLCIYHCPFGYQYDETGCQTCECIDPCQNHYCPGNEICVAEPVGCLSDSACGTRFKCIAPCKEILCRLDCRYGYELDCHGCPICRCREPCKEVICAKYHYCDVVPIVCITTPCPDYYAYCRNYCEDREIIMIDGTPIIDCVDDNVCGENNTCRRVEQTGGSICCGS